MSKRVRKVDIRTLCSVHLEGTVLMLSYCTSCLGEDISLLHLNFAGVELRDGSSQWLHEHVKSAIIHFTPLRINEADRLECVVYKKKVIVLDRLRKKNLKSKLVRLF